MNSTASTEKCISFVSEERERHHTVCLCIHSAVKYTTRILKWQISWCLRNVNYMDLNERIWQAEIHTKQVIFDYSLSTLNKYKKETHTRIDYGYGLYVTIGYDDRFIAWYRRYWLNLAWVGLFSSPSKLWKWTRYAQNHTYT